MREIKFRAWDGDLMYELGSLDLPWEHNDIKIMQFTGLKDMNVKEIYEGDMVAYSNKTFGVVEYIDDSFKIKWIKNPLGFNDCLSIHVSHGLEVIGNVWENPELLIDGNP